MTVQDSDTTHLHSTTEQDALDNEIDLTKFIDIFILWWREIVMLTILGAIGVTLVVLLLRQLQTPQYSASSDVLMARVINIASLDDRLQTMSGDNPISALSSTARRSALVGLAKNGAVAEAVITELNGLLSENEKIPANLVELVSAAALPSSDSRTPSDLIRITITADDPEKAATIANAWAQHYVLQINDLFGQVPTEVVDSVEAELGQADMTYQFAQRSLEAFIATDRTNEILQQIAEKTSQLDSLQNGREAALSAVINQEFEARLVRYANLVDTKNSSAEAVLIEQIEGRLLELSQLHAARNRASFLTEQARALDSQVELGGDAAATTNGLALQLLKAQAFAAEAITGQSSSDPERPGTISSSLQTTITLPVNLQIAVQVGGTGGQDAAEQIADVNALVSALSSYVERLDVRIAELSQKLLDGEGLNYLDELSDLGDSADSQAEESSPLEAAILRSYDQLFDLGPLNATNLTQDLARADNLTMTAMQQLTQELQELEAELEAEAARSQQLTQQRDVAWNTYDTLSNKVAELALERFAANREVRLGSLAVPPTQPLPGMSLSFAVVIGAILGFLLGIFIAFLATYLGYEPFLSRRQPSAA